MEKRFIGIEDLSVYIGICVNTLRYWVYTRQIPYLKVGKLVKFDIIEINSWLGKNKVKEMS